MLINHRPIRTAALFGLVSLVAIGNLSQNAAAQQATFNELTPLAGGNSSFTNNISADGTVIIGDSETSTGSYHATIWVDPSVGIDLGTLVVGGTSYATDGSSDGSTIVGLGGGNEAFRWTQATGMVGLGGSDSRAYAVSADGSVVVGEISQEASRWTMADGMVGLGFLVGGNKSRAWDVSADGSIVVGWSNNTTSPREAFIWTESGGMVGLGTLGGSRSSAEAISSDGLTVVGHSQNAAGETEAFVWTQANGMVGLGLLGGSAQYTVASAVSSDGSVVMGYFTATTGQNGVFTWTADTGMRDFQAVLTTDYGVDLTGWELDWAGGMSADNSRIVGAGTNPNGDYLGWVVEFVPNTSPGTDIVVEPSDATTGEAPVLLSFEEVTAAGETTLTTGEEGEPPAGFKLGNPATFYELSTSAEFNGSVEICIDYSGVSYDDEPGLRLFHLEDGIWIDVTTSVDPENDIICGEVTSFSPFVIVEADSDEDGLTDAREVVLGTNPFDPDTDDDGLLDGTEVEMATGSGCPDPLNADSDGDTLLDGFEVWLGISPCNPDTDGDQVPDQIDPDPLMPDEISDVLEEIARSLCLDIQSIDLSEFNGPNANANKGRRNSLSTRCANAANSIAEGNPDSAIALLQSVLEKIDDIEPAPDWMEESNAKTDLAANVSLLIELMQLE